ncbi:MAG: (2Fe-2S)-binding protein [Phycisphaeraceae bacterium]|nr:(2Fe-2S)-binding protein [Phycisphaeraceae bacterium]
MNPDDHVCLCFRVSLRKLRHFMVRTKPTVPSQLSECLGAGTGCHWCIPFLKHLHGQYERGVFPDLRISPEEYASQRVHYRATGERPSEGSDPPAPPDAMGPG